MLRGCCGCAVLQRWGPCWVGRGGCAGRGGAKGGRTSGAPSQLGFGAHSCVLAEDHKPAQPDERARIMAAGGFLSEIGGITRVNGEPGFCLDCGVCCWQHQVRHVCVPWQPPQQHGAASRHAARWMS